MPASRLHLVRHGEVFNPSGVLYERIEGFELSDLGHEMAGAAAQALLAEGRKIRRLIASPLVRTQQSAAPIAKQFGVAVDLDERVIEPWNKFKGIKLAPAAFLKRPSLILNLANPKLPSWGEPYDQVAARMRGRGPRCVGFGRRRRRRDRFSSATDLDASPFKRRLSASSQPKIPQVFAVLHHKLSRSSTGS